VRSGIQIDVGALRRNVTTLCRALDGAELWAVVKANAYGHGALDCGAAALGAGATALCTATVGEALALRCKLPLARLIVLGRTRLRSSRRPARRGSSS
jgi:alanine racemase